MILEVGSTEQKKGHVSKFLWGPPNLKVLNVSWSKSTLLINFVKISSVGGLNKIFHEIGLYLGDFS